MILLLMSFNLLSELWMFMQIYTFIKYFLFLGDFKYHPNSRLLEEYIACQLIVSFKYIYFLFV